MSILLETHHLNRPTTGSPQLRLLQAAADLRQMPIQPQANRPLLEEAIHAGRDTVLGIRRRRRNDSEGSIMYDEVRRGWAFRTGDKS